MAYTFGGATSDDISNMTLAVAAGGDNTAHLVFGWFHPTTLTAGLGFWSCGNTYGSRIAAATDEIQMDTDNTTDGMWETTDADITVDKWWFIAWLSCTENTTVVGQWRVWVGDINNAPTARTVVNTTARSGNYTGSQVFTIGNRGTGTVAFQGHIGSIASLVNNTVAINTWSTIGTSGVISAQEEDNVYRRFVLPAWARQPNMQYVKSSLFSSSLSLLTVDLNTPLFRAYQHSQSAVDFQFVPTINGATYSELRSPPIDPLWAYQMPFTPSRRR